MSDVRACTINRVSCRYLVALCMEPLPLLQTFTRGTAVPGSRNNMYVHLPNHMLLLCCVYGCCTIPDTHHTTDRSTTIPTGALLRCYEYRYCCSCCFLAFPLLLQVLPTSKNYCCCVHPTSTIAVERDSVHARAPHTSVADARSIE